MFLLKDSHHDRRYHCASAVPFNGAGRAIGAFHEDLWSEQLSLEA